MAEMQLTGTLKVNDRSIAEELALTLRRTGCGVSDAPGGALEFHLPWDPETQGSLLEAWQEIVFFLLSWGFAGSEARCQVRDLRFVPSRDQLPLAA